MEQQGWDTPAFDDADWSSVDLLDAPKGKLASTNMPPEREIDVMEATEITETFKHSFIFKFPKNTSGWPRLNVSGPKGTRVVLRSFEAFDNRNFGHINKQGTYQTDTYILKGEGVEIFEPSLTYHGFQYVEVIGYPGEPTRESVKAVVVHTDLEQVGTFECSSELLNDIQDMTTNSYLTNYQGLPLDCPTREKGGWTADGYLAAETGLLNFDAYTSHSKWVDDMLDCQHTDGRVPDIVPTDAWGYNGHFDWDCVIIYMPWYDYLYTGNREILTRSYEGMKACYDHYFAKAEDGILDDGRGDHAPFLTPTPTTVTVTAILSDCAHIIAKIAKLTGNKNDAKAYHQKAEYVKNAFLKKHLVANGTVANGSITAQSCALYYNLVPEDQKYAVVSKLVEAVHKANDHVDFGIFGAKYAFSVLSENGYHNLACTMVLQRTFPGYGWWVERGLTAQAENWDCRTDLNHIMFGDISAWFYRHLGGIKPKIESPGFKDFILEPRTDKRLDFVNSEHKSPYGLIVSNWKREGDLVEYHFTIPVNTTAHIILEGEPINSKSLIKGNSGKYEQYVGGGSYVFKMQQ
jgi:alpha-L-rhamnosidase